MDWTAGYASDIEYTAGFYAEQSPAHLNFVCAINGYEPVPLDRPFTYCELGFGRGLTANVLAASNPNGQFYAADFNPAHVAGAQALADSAGLANLTLMETSFEAMARGEGIALPMFDFITLHGIYTWVTAENRQYIVDFIARYLKPGGIVYMSYNAMPGWSASLPLQRMLVEYGDAHPGRSDQQITQAAGFIQKLADAQSAYFIAPELTARLATLAKANRNYLAHEYMHKHWQPLYHADVARDVAQAKLDFVGLAELPWSYRGMYLSQEKQDLIATFADSPMRETLKDYMLNTGFRKDVYVRGARKMTALRLSEWLSEVRVMLLVPREQVNFEMPLPFGKFRGNAIYEQVCDALAAGPLSLGQLGQLPALAEQSLGALAQVAVLMSSAGQMAIHHGDRAGVDAAPAQRLNRALAAQVRYSDDYPALCSPLLGTGMAWGFIDRLVYGMAVEQDGAPDLERAVGKAFNLMKMQSRRMVKDGVTLESDDDNQAEVRRQVQQAIALKLPLWRALRML